MLPNPLHPAVVHFPIVLVMLLPLFALGALWMIRRGAAPRRAWALVCALSAALTLSAWAALQTGQAQEDRVEEVLIREAPLHDHEEAAERFLALSAVLLVVTGVGLAGGVVGRAGRVLATAGALGLVAAGVQVGKSGGALVYEHGAANAYLRAPDLAQAPRDTAAAERDD